MIRKHFQTRAELEQQMQAARQLRSETLAGAVRVLSAGALGVIRRMLLRIAAQSPRRA